MANDLAIIAGGDKIIELPAHIAARFKPEDSNILTGDRTPSLTVKGKVFTMNVDGESNPLMRKDEDGNEYPVSSVAVVVLDYGAKMGRSYYEGAYDPNDAKAPTCWSLDSITPEEEVPDEIKTEKTSYKCATCPMAVKGSSVTDQGKSAMACSMHRILAVVPIRRMDLAPMRLRIAQTSNYDGRSPELKQKGMFAFQNFLDALKTRGIPHTQAIATKLSFDPNAAYPKLLFQALRFLDDNEVTKVDEILASGRIDAILGRTGTMAIKANPALAAPAAAKALPAPKTDTPEVTAARRAAEAKTASGLTAPVESEEDAAVMAELHAKATQASQATVTQQLQASVAEPEDEEAAMAAKLEAIRAKKAAAAAAPKAESPAVVKLRAEAASVKAAVEADPDDEELVAMASLIALRLRKAIAADAGVAAAAPAAEAPKAEAAPKKASTKKKPADPAKEAAVEKAGDQKFLPHTISGADFSEDDESGTMTILPPEGKPKAAAAAAPKKVTEANTAVQVPKGVEDMLQTWDD